MTKKIRVGSRETFALHLAERLKDGKTTTYDGKKCRVINGHLDSDQKSVLFTIEFIGNYEVSISDYSIR
ncbi:TPA: hypothetical protein ACX6RX_003191 [Photobacterium damselae]